MTTDIDVTKKIFKYKVLYQNIITGDIWNITQLIDSGIQHYTDLDGQAGRLSFTLQADPEKNVKLSSGGIIQFTNGKQKIFHGKAFVHQTDSTGVYKITAYDQMRYLKNQDSIVQKRSTASAFFIRLCRLYKLKHRVITPTRFAVAGKFHNKQTLYQMLEHNLIHTNVAAKSQKKYFVRADFNRLIFSEIGRHKTNLILGDKSLVNDYTYEVSIDKDTYNRIKITRPNKKGDTIESFFRKSSKKESRWGILQYVEETGKDNTKAQITKTLKNLLKVKGAETRSLRLSAVGIHGILAGSGVRVKIKGINLNMDMWVQSATHTYFADDHIMELEMMNF